MVLGFTQQVALVPIFLHFWTSDVLAAWLVIYAVGNLILIADCGLQFRAINRFLAFKSSVDCNGRTARFYAALLWVYLGLGGVLAVVVLAGAQLVSPSVVFKFQAVADFDAAFVVMAVGMLLALPSGLVGGMYRARGLYGRAVWLQGWATAAGQVAQLVAIIVTGSLLAVTIVYVATQALLAIYLLAIDAPRLFPFLRGVTVKPSARWIIGQFRRAAPFGLAGATELALVNLPMLLVSALVSDRVAVAQWGLTRVVAGLLRALCLQTTLPLAAELGHDHAIGATDRLRSLYARGSVFVAVLASAVVSGLLAFWQDFFALWTNDAIPYDPPLTTALLIGTSAIAPAILALSYANYSNRGRPSGAHQRPAARGLSDFIVAVDSAAGTAGGRRCDRDKRPVDSIRLADARHPSPDPATAASARPVFGSCDDRDHAVGVGGRHSDPVGDTMDRLATLHCRMRAMAGRCGDRGQSAGDRARPQEADRGDSAMRPVHTFGRRYQWSDGPCLSAKWMALPAVPARQIVLPTGKDDGI